MKAKYLFDGGKFKANVEAIRRAFRKQGIEIYLGYSVKTNNHPIVLELARKCGMAAEVVSPDELKLSAKIGYNPHEVIFNGVISAPELKFTVASKHGIVNVNDIEEFYKIEKVAQDHDTQIEIGFRVNFENGSNVKSRFGIEYGSEEYKELLKAAEKSEYVKIVGVHNHTTFARGIEYWKVKAQKLAMIAKELNLSYVDLGSNFYGEVHPEMVANYHMDVVPFDKYAEVVAKAFHDEYGKEDIPELILEPGTPVVANAVDLIAEVTNIREVRGVTLVELNCSVFDFRTPNTKAYNPFDVIHNSDGKYVEGAKVVGNTCVELDVIRYGYDGIIGIGDYVVIRNIGAYSVSRSHDFITKKLKMIRIN